MSEELTTPKPLTLLEIKAFMEPYFGTMQEILSIATRATFSFLPEDENVKVCLHPKGLANDSREHWITITVPNEALLQFKRADYFDLLLSRLQQPMFQVAFSPLFKSLENPVTVAIPTAEEQQEYLSPYASEMVKIMKAVPNAVFSYMMKDGVFYIILHPADVSSQVGLEHYIVYTVPATAYFGKILHPAFEAIYNIVISNGCRERLPLLYNSIEIL